MEYTYTLFDGTKGVFFKEGNPDLPDPSMKSSQVIISLLTAFGEQLAQVILRDDNRRWPLCVYVHPDYPQ